MVMIHEFRVPLHMTVDEFQVAQLYMVVDASEKMTGDGEGVEILKNEPYDNTDGKMGVSEISGWTIPRTKGQYTRKHYYVKSKIPGFVSAFCPEDSMVLIEEAWNAYPHCVTVIVNGYLAKNKFYICIESNHLPDSGDTENAVNMSNNELSNRTVEYLDIAQKLPKQTLKDDCDPSTYKSVKTSRGPLQKGWQKKVSPVMTCYKAVRVNFEYWGVQGKAEKIIRDQQRQLFHHTLRQAQCLTDDWFGLTMDDIRRLEENVAAKLEAKRLQGTSNQ
uniref:Phosphatidylinositol transfer protein N-terminal domain-containing protein n=1 Tax=Globisporangium ultimum (strain ATCC 200006 / CBS 805.95 / DAOM BR144) TaxID=431595 RepID=K3W5H1_GLOUD